MKKMRKLSMFMLSILTAICLTAAVFSVNPTAAATDDGVLTAEDFSDGIATLFTADGDYTLTGEAPSVVNGATSTSYATWGGWKTVTPSIDNISDLTAGSGDVHFSIDDMKSGSSDGKAIALRFDDIGVTTYQFIKFNKKVAVKDIDTLTFRVYANFGTYAEGEGYCGYDGNGFANDPTVDGKPANGIYLYGESNTEFANGSGLLFDPCVSQRKWTDVTIYGADLAKLADSEGYITGVRFGSAFMSGGPTQFYNGDWAGNADAQSYDQCASLFIDGITVGKDAVTIDAETGKAVLMTGNGDYTLKKGLRSIESMNEVRLNNEWQNGGFLYQAKEYAQLNDLTASDSEDVYYDMNEVKSGSEDGYALVTDITNWGYTANRTVMFAKPIKTDGVHAISFRMYLNLSTADTYGYYNAETDEFYYSQAMQDSFGIYIYGAHSGGNLGEGILIKPDVVQREWIDYVISDYDMINRLADASGYIGGFKLAAGCVVADGTDFIIGPNGGVAYDLGNTIMIDSVTAYSGHVESDWIVDTEATCAVDGTKHTECLSCGEKMNEGTITADHTYGDWVDEVPATCTENGTKGHKDCTGCLKHFDAEGNEITDLTIVSGGHTYGDWVDEVAATETTEGTKGHKDCTVCKKHFDAEGNEITDLTIAKKAPADGGDNGSCNGSVGANALFAGIALIGAAIVVARKREEN